MDLGPFTLLSSVFGLHQLLKETSVSVAAKVNAPYVHQLVAYVDAGQEVYTLPVRVWENKRRDSEPVKLCAVIPEQISKKLYGAASNSL